MSRKILTQYEFNHKMNRMLAHVFKTYLHHEENIAYEDILIGDHGDEGVDMVLFNISKPKATHLQVVQDGLLKPAKREKLPFESQSFHTT